MTKKPKTFTMERPVVGHREYVTRGPSGYPETYLRTEADAMLRELLGDFPLLLAVDQFIKSDPVKREGLQWIHVTNYLARQTKTPSPEQIPIPAGIAFWAQAIIAKRVLDAPHMTFRGLLLFGVFTLTAFAVDYLFGAPLRPSTDSRYLN